MMKSQKDMIFLSSILIKRFSKAKSFALDDDVPKRRDIPFINSDLNAKGVIYQAFEMYRLKSCVDFKPYEGENTYIKFEKLDGCWSMVGDLQTGQQLSLGESCDYKGTIMHELLHALGFYHEQSRSDRDDYVDIWYDQVLPGFEHNFGKYDDSFITDQNTPYDYESIMHYGPYSFNKDPRYPTITAKDPELTSVLGQYNDFSSLDLLRLNRMYNCSSSLTLLDQCAFESINSCGMIQNRNDDDDWVRTRSTPESPDHTLTGRCRGHFMHFPTDSGQQGDSAFLVSRILYPKRKLQCLQFFYKMTGSPKDKLVIWVRREDTNGQVMSTVAAETIMGDDDHSWKIAHVPLKADGKSRYSFQGIRGDPAQSQGGIFIDDISLAETRCPSGTWRIKNFSWYLKAYAVGEYIQSPRFYSPEGYGFGIQLLPNSYADGYVGAFFHLTSGENDEFLQWPAGNRQVTITLLDQDSDIRMRQSFSFSFTTDGKQLIPGSNSLYWDKPSVTGTYDPSCDCYRSWTWGWNAFFSHYDLNRRNYLKNDDLILFIEFEDLTPLINTEVPIQPRSQPDQRPQN
ncbi:hypothetical protein JZ751_009195 [Albula glossodonta]|uniref:Metalloendopeptidase n=1 Tax=Albula glossodonta TaxID=121402 RepID=A0A8T2ML50_9TELE|nr:hypothetical protein JZ751_009195 [Albula glossodonta]